MKKPGAEYTQVYSPDKELLAQIVTAAKGPDRSMAQFADETKVGASTLSRIVNQRITKPISVEALESIYENRASGCKITKAQMMRANGMVLTEEYERRRNQARIRREDTIVREGTIRKIIPDELFARNVSIQRLPVSEKNDTAESNLFNDFIVCDMVIEVTDDNHRYPWGFNILASVTTSDQKEDEARWYVRSAIRRYAVLFLIDAWETESFNDMKLSFVFADELIYRMFVNSLKEKPIRNRFTAILVDAGGGAVIDEKPLGAFSDDCFESIFSRPAVDTESPAERDFGHLDFEQHDGF